LPLDLTGRLVVLSGASSGIGRDAVRAFVRDGARVVGLARDGERLAALGAELGSGGRFDPLVADVTDAASMTAAARHVLDRHGVPDVVVANAGMGLDALLTETTDEALAAVFEVNVFGAFRIVRPFVAGMIERGSGRILLVSSIVGKRGTPHYSAYSASKFALHGLADAWRAELVGTGVTVGLVCPGSTDTEFRQRSMQSGPPQRSLRPRRHGSAAVAAVVVRMARSRRREIVIGIESKLLVAADLLAPGLVDRLLARALTSRPPQPGAKQD
jgi:NAD(P)-dependent dehydrogenase (short-subunit alcohol dehydrogenase family)